MTVTRRASALALALALLPAPPAAEPQQNPLAVAPDPTAGYRPLVRLGPVLDDPALEEAARAGLPLRVRFRVELWRDGLFDRLAGAETWTGVVLYEPLEGHYTVRTRASPALTFTAPTFPAARAALERAYLPALRPTRPGRYYYIATVEVETLSLSDLEELEQWLKGAVRADRSLPGALGEGARRLLVRILRLPARRHEAKSEPFRVP